MIRWIGLVSLVVLAGCSAGPTGDAPVADVKNAATLRATLASPTDIDLVWTITDPAASGQVVEYSNEENGQYTILAYLPPTSTTFRHPDLIPQTPFYYRIRTFHGPASSTVDTALPPGASGTEPQGDEEWMRATTLPGGPVRQGSVRDPGNAPTDFTATVVQTNGLAFKWTDNTSDEEGFLLEVKPDGAPDFTVATSVDVNVNSFGMIPTDDERKATYRVRPYRFGPPTNTAHQTTGGTA
ncbi:fibronectin type III domain-containing protein [Kibdelosporangium philippinense]|uniref:Fibronectin type III domain-containing protein n=1 Tax=Kibdelosporangium philippinense TaxID=211113 RepID=A0ABS8Z5K1_9PSEU|nr:fibronectin type III domain-containing protein [Kibdelosporangium philippinense]MCE7001916.1 fibronectin type III domain-containing protein [Kibdelosporangium philippinense]